MRGGPFPPPPSSLCSGKGFVSEVKYLAQGKGSFMQNHDGSSPSVAERSLHTLPPAVAWPETLSHGSPATQWPVGEAGAAAPEKAGGAWAPAAAPGQSLTYQRGREACAGLGSIPESAVTVSFHTLIHLPNFC